MSHKRATFGLHQLAALILLLVAGACWIAAFGLFELVYGRKARASGELDTLEGALAADAA